MTIVETLILSTICSEDHRTSWKHF